MNNKLYRRTREHLQTRHTSIRQPMGDHHPLPEQQGPASTTIPTQAKAQELRVDPSNRRRITSSRKYGTQHAVIPKGDTSNPQLHPTSRRKKSSQRKLKKIHFNLRARLPAPGELPKSHQSLMRSLQFRTCCTIIRHVFLLGQRTLLPTWIFLFYYQLKFC